jgi:hypothetical protein
MKLSWAHPLHISGWIVINVEVLYTSCRHWNLFLTFKIALIYHAQSNKGCKITDSLVNVFLQKVNQSVIVPLSEFHQNLVTNMLTNIIGCLSIILVSSRKDINVSRVNDINDT